MRVPMRQFVGNRLKDTTKSERMTSAVLQMKKLAKRSILRWIHIVFGVPIIGYVYSPFEEFPNCAPLFGMSPSL
jgi:hypothetical protein